MPLKKPPIVEMWIEFRFEPGPDSTPANTQRFLDGYAGEYPDFEVETEDKMEFRPVPRSKLFEGVKATQSIRHFRSHNADQSRWLHVAKNQLVCSFLKLGESYPGFGALLDDSLDKLESYKRACVPKTVPHAAIHYVDLVEVPLPPSGEVYLEDYFTIAQDFPRSPFGVQVSFLFETWVRPLDGTGKLGVQLQLEKAEPGRNVMRFRMDWHKHCDYDRGASLAEIREGLERANSSAQECFRAAFTERGWSLFEPGE